MVLRVVVVPVHDHVDALVNGRLNDLLHHGHLAGRVTEVAAGALLHAHGRPHHVGIPGALQRLDGLRIVEGLALGEAGPEQGHPVQGDRLAAGANQLGAFKEMGDHSAKFGGPTADAQCPVRRVGGQHRVDY
jgi:hypothetical protein